jgi:hypothetical protein
MQEKIKKKRGRWKPGESGNPAGRTKDPRKLEAIELFKSAAPELIQQALDLARGGDKYMLSLLVKKALPDNIKIEGDMIIKTCSVKDIREALGE